MAADRVRLRLTLTAAATTLVVLVVAAAVLVLAFTRSQSAAADDLARARLAELAARAEQAGCRHSSPTSATTGSPRW